MTMSVGGGVKDDTLPRRFMGTEPEQRESGPCSMLPSTPGPALECNCLACEVIEEELMLELHDSYVQLFCEFLEISTACDGLIVRPRYLPAAADDATSGKHPEGYEKDREESAVIAREQHGAEPVLVKGD